jgi:hypothetical protein
LPSGFCVVLGSDRCFVVVLVEGNLAMCVLEFHWL